VSHVYSEEEERPTENANDNSISFTYHRWVFWVEKRVEWFFDSGEDRRSQVVFEVRDWDAVMARIRISFLGQSTARTNRFKVSLYSNFTPHVFS
jgi:hypothetical protein